jgi:hypothetical protein
LREQHDLFIAAHRAGMTALNDGDIDGFAKAVAIERGIIDEQDRLIRELRGLSKA